MELKVQRLENTVSKLETKLAVETTCDGVLEAINAAVAAG